METITVATSDNVTTVTLNRPPVNAVTRQMMRELTAVFEGFAEDHETRAVVLQAQGDRAFCAGIDLREIAESRQADAPRPALSETLNPGLEWRNTQHAIRMSPIPVVAAVEAATIGAGFGLVAVCDIIVASPNATFGLTEINVGLLGGASKALQMVGHYKTRMMMYTGQMQTAEDFYRLGAIEEITQRGRTRERAREIAMTIASKSPLAVRLAKEAIVRIEGHGLEDRYRTEWDYTNRLAGFNDSEEAMRAFLEKREPVWTWS